MRACLIASLVLALLASGSPLDPPLPAAPGGRPEASLSIPRLSIVHAPVWSRGRVAARADGLGFAVVPRYGVTRFRGSVPFGRPGLTVAYGDDDAHGGIFHWLSALQPARPHEHPPFPGDEIQVWSHGHLYRYHVRRLVITAPGDERMLTHTYRRPTLVLISRAPYRVDTLRVFVQAQI